MLIKTCATALQPSHHFAFIFFIPLNFEHFYSFNDWLILDKQCFFFLYDILQSKLKTNFLSVLQGGWLTSSPIKLSVCLFFVVTDCCYSERFHSDVDCFILDNTMLFSLKYLPVLTQLSNFFICTSRWMVYFFVVTLLIPLFVPCHQRLLK